MDLGYSGLQSSKLVYSSLIFVDNKLTLICLLTHTYTHTHTHTHNRLTAFVRDNPGRPVPEETLTHSHPSWSSDGATENARHENTVRSKMQDLKMRDMNLRHQFAQVEIAGHENAGPTCRNGKCRTWKCETNLQGWKMREKLVWKAKVWKSVSK